MATEAAKAAEQAAVQDGSTQAHVSVPSPTQDARADFMSRLEQQRTAQASAREEIVEQLAILVGAPKDPAVHAKLGFAYARALQPADMIESFSNALSLVLSTHPNADVEAELLACAPNLVERALIGRSGDCDFSAEAVLAQQLITLAERLGPQSCPANALANARRTLGSTQRRCGKYADAVTMFRLADEAARPGFDLQALREIPDVELFLAHAAEGPERTAHAEAAIAAARKALAATPESDEIALAESCMLLARVLYSRLCLAHAPPMSVLLCRPRETVPGILHSDPWSESLRLQPDDAMALESHALAAIVKSEAARLGGLDVWHNLADLLTGRLEAAGLKPIAS